MTAIDRRTLAKGAAWTLPALAVAAAAPSLDASTTPPEDTCVNGYADKCPGVSDVPGGYPKHGYRVLLTIAPTPSVVVPVEVRQNNGKIAQILTDAVYTGLGWEFIVDAKSSPSKLTVIVNVDGTLHTIAIKASPHCGRG